MKLSENRRKILKVATLYYDEGLTQAQIAKKVGISRPIISKMLQQAKELGIVEVFIKDENAQLTSLAIALENKYHLQDVIVVAENGEMAEDIMKQQVGRAGASYLTHHLSEIKEIGISWGTTMASFIEEMQYSHYPKIGVRPLAGGVATADIHLDANHLAFLLSKKIAGKCSYLYAPALADTLTLKQELEQSAMVSEALDLARNVDFAVVGVGNPDYQTTWEERGYLGKNDIKSLKEAGMVGDCIISFFDEKGQPVENELTKRMIGTRLEALKKIKKVMLLASGNNKAKSVAALLQSGAINILVINQGMAKVLLEEGSE